MEIRVRESCIRCGRCARVCPSQIFVQEEPRGAVSLRQPGNCILCGHCVAACPTGSVAHEGFPPERVHAFDRRDLPTPERVELLLAVRRSNRALSDRPVPPEWLDRIIAAADRAPTASNARELGYTLVTDPERLREVTEYTLRIFRKLERLLSNPLVKPWLKPLMPGAYRYLPVFARLRREYAAGRDRILRGATALLFIHAPRASRFGVEDANLACQNASLMAEALGVSQIYMGFVLTAVQEVEPDARVAGTPHRCGSGFRNARVPLSQLHRPRSGPEKLNPRSSGVCKKGAVFDRSFLYLYFRRFSRLLRLLRLLRPPP